MAAFETPFLEIVEPMSSPRKSSEFSKPENGPTPTVAAFSPTSTLTGERVKRTIIVDGKSPLLATTPPQITRALAYSHPFILPLNRVLGLITWSSGDPWESFLVIAAYWAVMLYGDVLVLWASPVILALGLIVGLYARKYSPLSTSDANQERVNNKREAFGAGTKHRKSLDEILETLNVFVLRCNLLLEPLIGAISFLSAQQTASALDARSPLTTLFLRIFMVLPLWITLTFPPLRIISTQRVLMVVGTIFLTWHSRPARVARTILWRSASIRKFVSLLTGLDFAPRPSGPGFVEPIQAEHNDVVTAVANASQQNTAGVKFTFAVYENQRRWIGLGWTNSLFAYERAPWTDEHLNATNERDEFALPVVQNGQLKWQWAPNSTWKIEGAGKGADGEGWIYYDNKWADGRREDGWGRYTRRRKWYRDAELIEPYASSSGSNARLSPGEEDSSVRKRTGFFRSASGKHSGKTERNPPPVPNGVNHDG